MRNNTMISKFNAVFLLALLGCLSSQVIAQTPAPSADQGKQAYVKMVAGVVMVLWGRVALPDPNWRPTLSPLSILMHL